MEDTLNQDTDQFGLIVKAVHKKLPDSCKITIEGIKQSLKSFAQKASNNSSPDLPPGAETGAMIYPSIEGLRSTLEELGIDNLDLYIESIINCSENISTILRR